jgi:hypothetical protein
MISSKKIGCVKKLTIKWKFDTIQVASNFIQYCHSNGTYFHKIYSFIHYFIVIGNME